MKLPITEMLQERKQRIVEKWNCEVFIRTAIKWELERTIEIVKNLEEQQYEQIRQEAIDEFRQGLLEEIAEIDNSQNSNDDLLLKSIRLYWAILEKINSYNLPTK